MSFQDYITENTDDIDKVMKLFKIIGIKNPTKDNAKKFIAQKGTVGSLLKEIGK